MKNDSNELSKGLYRWVFFIVAYVSRIIVWNTCGSSCAEVFVRIRRFYENIFIIDICLFRSFCSN